MSDVSFYLDQIRDTQHRIHVLEAYALDHPDDAVTNINLMSLSMRAKRLFQILDEVAEAQGVDICKYRFLPEGTENYPLVDVAASLDKFQRLISIIYDAVKNGPKDRASLSTDVRTATEFGFGHTFSGSLGVALTVPNPAQLFDHELDSTIERAFELARVEDAAALRNIVRLVGRAPVRKLYDWAKSSVDSGLAVDIRWKRGAEARFTHYASTSDMARILDIIDGTEDVQESKIEKSGRLVGLDIEKKSFHFKSGDDDFSGSLSDGFAVSDQYVVPDSYVATIKTVTTVKLSTGKESKSEILEMLSKNIGSPL